MSACLSVATGSWSTGNCDKAITFLSDYTTSEDSLFTQAATIRRDYCAVNWSYSSPEREKCLDFVPDFWISGIAKVYWPVAWSHLCDDIVGVDTSERSGRKFTCEECELRVDLALETMRDPLIQDWWVETLETSYFCEDYYVGIQDVCQEHIKDVFPDLVLVVTNFRGWVPDFCLYTMRCNT